MKAVILAAGQGLRMRAAGASKPMVTVEGTALLERVIRNAMSGGVNDFIIVTGYNGTPLQHFVSDLSRKLPCTLTCVENTEWHRGNGRSVLTAKKHIGGPFHVLMADHLVDPSILKRVRMEPLPPHGVRLAVDFRLKNPHVDMEDVTKVLCRNNRILSIGKSLTAFNGFDTGVFWCTPALFNALEESIAANGDDTLSGGIRVLAKAGLMYCSDIGERTWIDVDTPAVLDLAQQALSRSYDMAG